MGSGLGKGRRWLPTTPGTVSTPGRSAMGTTGSPTTEYLESVGTIPQDRSPPPAGIQPHPRMVRPCRSGKPPAPWGGSHAEEGSNFRPAVLETAALPTELSAYSWAGGIRTRVPGLNVRCSIPLSYSLAHTRRYDRRICGMRSPSPYGVAEDGVSSTLSIFNRIGTSLHQGPHVGRLGSNQHPLALYHLSYTPDGRRSTRPPLSGRRRRLRIGEAPAGKPSTDRRPPGHGPATPPLQRVRWTVSASVNGSQAGQDSNLQHTVPKTVVLPNCTTRLYHRGLHGRDGHGLRAQSPAGHPPPVPEETGTARLYATMLCLVCHDKVDAAGA